MDVNDTIRVARHGFGGPIVANPSEVFVTVVEVKNKMNERSSRTQPSVKPSELALRYEEIAVRELRSAGFRITMPRVQVIRALSDTTKALSAYAIHEKIIANGGKIDVVSVYRILSTLQSVGLVHHIGVVNGYFPRRLNPAGAFQSEVMVLEDSGDVIELNLPDAVIAEIEQQAQLIGLATSTIKVEIVATAR